MNKNYELIVWGGASLGDYNNFGGFNYEFVLNPSQKLMLKRIQEEHPTFNLTITNLFNYIANRAIDILNLSTRNNVELFGFNNLKLATRITLIKCIYLMINDIQGKGVDIDFYYGIKDNTNFTQGTSFNYTTNWGSELGLFDKLPPEVKLLLNYIDIRNWDSQEIDPSTPDTEKYNFIKPLVEDENKNVSLKIDNTLKVDTDGNLGVIPINNIKAIAPLEKTSDGSLKLNYTQKFKLDSNNNLDISSDLTDKTLFKFNTDLPNSTNVVSGDVLKVKTVENGEITEFEFGENGRNKTLKYEWVNDKENWSVGSDESSIVRKTTLDTATRMYFSISFREQNELGNTIISTEIPINLPQDAPTGKYVLGYNGDGVQIDWIDYINTFTFLKGDDHSHLIIFEINEVYALVPNGIPGGEGLTFSVPLKKTNNNIALGYNKTLALDANNDIGVVGGGGENKILKYEWVEDTANWEVRDNGSKRKFKLNGNLESQLHYETTDTENNSYSGNIPIGSPSSDGTDYFQFSNGYSKTNINSKINLSQDDTQTFLVMPAVIIKTIKIWLCKVIETPVSGNLPPQYFIWDIVNNRWDFTAEFKAKLESIGDAKELQGIPIKILSNKK